MRAIPFLAGVLGVLAAQVPASAADPYGTLPSPTARPRMFEIRLGAYLHDPVSPEKGSVDINGEFLVDPFLRDRSTLWGALVPRLHIGTTGNFTNKTSQAYMGFTWSYDFTQRFFIEGGLGIAAHNGKTALLAPLGFNAMGCHWGFHEQGALGYRLTESWSVMLTVEHTSNGGACKQNRGLTNVGMRLGYAF